MKTMYVVRSTRLIRGTVEFQYGLELFDDKASALICRDEFKRLYGDLGGAEVFEKTVHPANSAKQVARDMTARIG